MQWHGNGADLTHFLETLLPWMVFCIVANNDEICIDQSRSIRSLELENYAANTTRIFVCHVTSPSPQSDLVIQHHLPSDASSLPIMVVT